MARVYQFTCFHRHTTSSYQIKRLEAEPTLQKLVSIASRDINMLWNEAQS